MTRTKIVLLLGAAVVGTAGWYWFRPERAFINSVVSEPAPATEAVVLSSGQFQPEAHEGEGVARVVRLPDGRHVLSLSQFRTLNGPDVRVYLLGAADVRDGAGLARAGYLDLGALKGNIGDQSYDIPAGTDLGRYAAVSVWCRRFGVNFTMAALSPL